MSVLETERLILRRFTPEDYRFPRIVALINPENVGSVRVAEKVGLKYERDVNFRDYGQVALYALKAEDFVTAEE